MLRTTVILPYVLASLSFCMAIFYENPDEVREFHSGDPIELVNASASLYFPFAKGKIPRGTFSELPDTVSLKISFRITYVEPGAFLGLDNLENLDLSWNIIKVLENDTFHGLTELQTLNLEGNKINRMYPGCFGALESLRHLTFEFNLKLRTLKDDIFFGLISLETLNLNRCGISEIEEHAFSDLTALKTLSMSRNRISKFPRYALNTCPELTHVDLSNNRIENIDDEVLRSILVQLRVLDVSENPWVCDVTSQKISFEDLQIKAKYSDSTFIIGNCLSPVSSGFW